MVLVHHALIRLIATAVILALAALVAFPTRKRVERSGRRWAREWQAYVPEELVPAFDRRTRASFRLAGMGVAAVALAVGVGLFDRPSTGPLLVYLTSALTPLMVWRVVRGMPGLRAAGTTRVARPRASRFDDYLPRWSVLVGIASAFGPILFLGLIAPTEWGHGGLFVATVLQAVSGLLSAVALVKVAGTSLPAADMTQLYLQDADRASSMCSVLVIPAFWSMMLIQQIQLTSILDGHHGAQAATLLAFAPMGALAVVRELAKRRFRRTLWPSYATSQPGAVRSTGGALT